MKKLQLLFLICLALLLVACDGGNNGQNTTASPTAQPVNGFGSTANHIHSLVVLPDTNHTMLLATHYGIFRSQNQGATWQEMAGGPDQLMQGVMTYNLSYNLLDPQRLYVLTFVQGTGNPHPNELGLYTSGNGGTTWKMSIADSSITSGTIFFAQAGNDNPSEVYIYLNELGPLGLRVSMDNGQHFEQAGTQLPFGNVLGLLPIPNKPGHLMVYGNDGIATTTDGGRHWQVVPGVQDSIFEMTTPGPNDPIYARGDSGIYVSQDSGKSFTLVYTKQSFASLTASPQQSQIIYGKLGLGVYRSADGGRSWSELPVMQSSQQSLTGDVLAADPTDANQVYLVISYPVVAYHFQSAGHAWKSITPPV